ncbi:MAG TPA: hypothetical protein VI547_09140, partial [Anaerolineales bacterium]|nr:hypothetical protein [Anaerolineales bacterium]
RWIEVVSSVGFWRFSLMALMFVRLAMWWLLQHDAPRLIDHYRWHFYHGGDEVLFFRIAQEILSGRLEPTTVGVGLPLMMAGLIRFMNTVDYEQVLPAVVIGNGVLFGLLSVPVIASLGRTLSGSRAQGLLTGAVWALLPYLLWAAFGIHSQADLLRNAYVSRQMWVSGITDGPSFLFVTLGMVFALQSQKRSSLTQIGLLVVGGAWMGWAAAIRFHVLPVAAVAVVAFIWSRQWGAAAWLIAGLLIGFMPQFWHNAVANGHPLNTPYLNSWLRFDADKGFIFNLKGSPISPRFLLTNMLALARRLPLLVSAGTALAVIGLYAFRRNWQKCGSGSAIIMFSAPLASFGLHVVTYVFAEDPVRFTLPAAALALPAVMWTGYVVLDEIDRRARRGRRVATD